MINYQLTIQGRVQGVGFRWSVYQLALRLGVTGIVKNCPDGSVYCELQGDQTTVNAMIEQIKAGPTPYAKITTVHVTPGQVKNYQNSFQITR